MLNKKENAEEIKVGRMVLTEDDLTFTVTYNAEIFTMRHLAPYERQAVEADIVRRLGGYARDTHNQNHVAMVEAAAYVDATVVLEESPSWFKSAWTCYDEDCIVELYRGLLSFQTKFREQFKEHKP